MNSTAHAPQPPCTISNTYSLLLAHFVLYIKKTLYMLRLKPTRLPNNWKKDVVNDRSWERL